MMELPKLLEYEELVERNEVPIAPLKDPDPEKWLMKLTRVEKLEDVGKEGPVYASTVDEDNAGSEELRLYEVFFPRDAFVSAMFLAKRFPALLKATIMESARLQGVVNHLHREEEPGRIPHEVRNPETDPIARKISEAQNWEWPYYGAVDNTARFILGVQRYADLKGADFLQQTFVDLAGKERTIQSAVERAGEWIVRRLGSNPESLLLSQPAFPGSHLVQFYADAWDSFSYPDGRVPMDFDGIVSIDTLALTYDALRAARRLSRGKRQQRLAVAASRLYESIWRNCWLDTKGYFAGGVVYRDDRLEILPIRKSLAGHTLNSELMIGRDDKVETLVEFILSEDMLAAGGIRSISDKEVRYGPGRYHTGNVWLWETAYIAQGLERCGYSQEADDLRSRVIRAIGLTGLFPEYVRGEQETVEITQQRVVAYDHVHQRNNTVEQPPQVVQAWTLAALWYCQDKIEEDVI